MTQEKVINLGPYERILTLDDLLEVAEVDPDMWEVKRWKPNSYEQNAGGGRIMQLFQVKATLERLVSETDEELIEELKSEAAEHAPTYKVPEYSPTGDRRFLLELDVFDHHFGMYAWGAELGGASYDLEIAARLYRQAFGRLTAMASAYPIEKILVPLGNDLFAYDKYQKGNVPTTTAGTSQDVDSRRRKLYVAVRQLQVEIIEALRMIAPVEVIVVPGNHDEDSSFTLGDSLWCWFHKDPAVEINNAPSTRKYVRYGQNLIGFEHGKEIPHKRLPNTMAHDAKEAWAETEYREFHLGHKHRSKRSVPVPLEDHGGVLVRELPSLCPPDSWHYRKAFGGQRGAKAFLWHPEGGVQHEFTLNIPNDAEEVA